MWESSKRPKWKLWLPEAKPSQWSLPRGVGWVGQIIDQRISPHSQHMVIGHLYCPHRHSSSDNAVKPYFTLDSGRSKPADATYAGKMHCVPPISTILCWLSIVVHCAVTLNTIALCWLSLTVLTFNCKALCCDFQLYCTSLTNLSLE